MLAQPMSGPAGRAGQQTHGTRLLSVAPWVTAAASICRAQLWFVVVELGLYEGLDWLASTLNTRS